MASRFVSILQWVASCDAQAACPPFFDFAFQELRHRVHELPQADIRRAAELFSQVHLERPDLLPSAASALARAARPPEELPEVALYLSTLAGLYSRVAALPKSEEASSQEERRTALMALAEKLSGGAETVQDLLTPSTVAHDATFLALSAFAQAVCRPVDDVPAARELVLQAGLRLFDSLCRLLMLVHEVAGFGAGEPRFSPQHVHIFITALRSFCVGKGSASPPVSCLDVLQGVVQHTVASAADSDKEARLCLAVLQELATDPACPGSLKAILPGLEANEVHSVQGGEPSGPGGTAQRRLRAAMAASPGSQGVHVTYVARLANGRFLSDFRSRWLCERRQESGRDEKPDGQSAPWLPARSGAWFPSADVWALDFACRKYLPPSTSQTPPTCKVYTYIDTCMHTYIHTYIPVCVCAYDMHVSTFVHMCMRSSIHAHVCTYLCVYVG
ncbi:unnamed protein product [Symbiodinium necroappetens]|uniref:Uncharacterized protein n=1 Tax=Symbiodinium necroappetens TaxID=1628268 RepID=A0A812ZTN8_9DINO|nr:unnamed protein product [Symbiodinium necroappetens]